MWMGDYGITEIADIISYIDKFDNSRGEMQSLSEINLNSNSN